MRHLLLTLVLAMAPMQLLLAETRTAVFAGGCFWCMEKPFDELNGVSRTISGFAGGKVANPSYKQVSAGGTGHIEVVEITYDPALVSYEKLLEIYWANVDPVDAEGQFCDRGHTYTTAIFYTSERQHMLAEQSRDLIGKKLQADVVTDIRSLDTFYAAENYHQDYYLRNSYRYKYYRWRCGRDARLDELWGDNARKGVLLF